MLSDSFDVLIQPVRSITDLFSKGDPGLEKTRDAFVRLRR